LKPSLFVGSSPESLDVAYAIEDYLAPVARVTVWPRGIFGLSKSGLGSLLAALEGSDFGAFVLAADDIWSMSGSEQRSVRESAIFELGLFAGLLTKGRSFIAVPRGSEALFDLPTDWLGLTPVLYGGIDFGGAIRAALKPTCLELVTAIVSMSDAILATVRGECTTCRATSRVGWDAG